MHNPAKLVDTLSNIRMGTWIQRAAWPAANEGRDRSLWTCNGKKKSFNQFPVFMIKASQCDNEYLRNCPIIEILREIIYSKF